MGENNCDSSPEFPIVCSFLRHFGHLIGVQLNIEDLKSSLEDRKKVDNNLKMLHFELLRRTWRDLHTDQWEAKLSGFARSQYSQTIADEIKTKGYPGIKLSVKLELLSTLLHDLFEYDLKFQRSVELMSAKELRQLPVGRDLKGNSYWQFNDLKGNFRVLRTRPFDIKRWQTICYNKDELSGIIRYLSNFKSQLIKGKPVMLSSDSIMQLCPKSSDSVSARLNDDDEMKAISAYFIKRDVRIVCVKTARKELKCRWNGDLFYKPCIRCDKHDNPETTLLCEICDDCYHTTCCLPPLDSLPDQEWYCPTCEHDMLLINLRSLRTGIINILELEKEKERERALSIYMKGLEELDQTAVSQRSMRLLRPRPHTVSFNKNVINRKPTIGSRRSKRINRT